MPIAIDLFGCGGVMLLAMILAGFRVIASVDRERRWHKAIRANYCGPDRLLPHRPEVVSITCDLLRHTPQQVAQAAGIELHALAWVHTSPPCQDHSYAGSRERSGDGHDALLVPLWWAGACPNAFVTVENVVGVQDSQCFVHLIDGLRALGRETYFCTVKAAWYGVPQLRTRVWAISAPAGMRCPAIPAPTCDLQNSRTWEWAMNNPRPVESVDDYRFALASDWQSTLLPLVPLDGTSANITDPDALVWIDQMYSDSIRNFIRRDVRHATPSAVLTACAIGNILKHCHPWLNRTSTVRELARLQDIPDEFIFPASLTNAYRMVGEAIPVGMGLAWGRQIMRALGREPLPVSEHGILLPSRPDLWLPE